MSKHIGDAASNATKRHRRFKNHITSPVYAIFYVIFAAIVLFATTIFWAIQGAQLQMSNADQLVDPYLFEHGNVFQEALFPSQHTFLLKWPLFWLIKFYGFSTLSFVVVTVALVLVTVFGLAFILYRIEKRPLYLGTLLLGLASVLLFVPAQPHVGGLLPVNMAMLTTRNIEYLFFIGSLVLLLHKRRVRSWSFAAGIVLLGILIASDKLFLTLSIGGAGMALVAYSVAKGWKLVSTSVGWLLAVVISVLLAFAGLALLAALHVTQVISEGNAAGPYAITGTIRNFVLSVFYAVAGLFTNLGANPAFDATQVKQVPHELLAAFFNPGIVGYLVNSSILLAGLFVAWRLVQHSFVHNRQGNAKLDHASLLSLALIWTSLTAFAAFIATDHYYPVDARYLSITAFAIFIALATWSRRLVWKNQNLFFAGLVISVGIVFGVFQNIHTNRAFADAYNTIDDRNATVAQVLKQHHVDVLVGDYWRVLPVKKQSGNQQEVMPLQNCTQPRSTLTSTAWQPDLGTHHFAYLLSSDASLTDFPHCSLDQIIAAYGRPNASVLIAGSLTSPKEQLLFYDRGANKSAPLTKSLAQGPSTVVPISSEQLTEILPGIQCQSPTIMTIVAHEDDDLLFMNPDILQATQAGDCIRTVYITAGDAGRDKFYWIGREQGSQAAYSKMLNTDALWIERIVRLENGAYVSVDTPRGNSKVALIFMHLPDGNMRGQGFAGTNFESLEKLQAGKIQVIHATDGQSIYTNASLVDSLTELMHLLDPTEIHTQSNVVGTRFVDHSDHRAAGRFATVAYQNYIQLRYGGRPTIPLVYYLGYSGHNQPANLGGPQLAEKRATFLTYGQHDGGVCHTVYACTVDPAYGAYLSREYTSSF